MKLTSGSTLRVVEEVVGTGVKFGVFRGVVAFVDVFNSFAKAGAPVVPTLTSEQTRQTTGKLYPICAVEYSPR